ncbi:MAG: GrpB family protein [Nocardioides sp.]|nr:GrpB family protein [Nocardioides sp.]
MPSADRPGRRRPDVTGTELVGGVEKRELVIVEADPTWPQAFAQHEEQVRAALGTTAREIEHVGSTSVPGLAAKPIIDILVIVDDITAEEDYLQPLLGMGYQLRVREPGHRMVRTPALDVHIHILESGDPERDEYLLLRDHLRRTSTDRALYERTKRELVQSEWADMNAYAEAKTAVITQIKGRARVAE